MRAIATRTLAAFTLALGLAAVFAGQALADPPDRFDPAVVNATLQAGQSTTVNKTLHLTGLPAKADIIVAIDTTGSMGAALASAKADAVQICTDVQAAIPGARFAAVEFEDYPFSPYGAPTDDPYELRTTGYTASCAAFSAGVAAMLLGNGADGPESNNRVHFEAYSDPALLGTRDPQASRFLVMLADNVPHSVAAFGACPSTAPFSDPGRNNVNQGGGGDDIETPAAIAGLNADNHTLLYVSYIGGTGVHPCHSALATATGGVAVANEDAEDIGAFIISSAALVPYTVNLQVSAGCAMGISFSPAPPYGPFSGPSHPTFVETITAPTTAGNYSCTVTAVMSPGGPVATQTINLTVTPGPPARLTLTPPTATNTVGDQHCVTATVTDAFGNPVPGVAVTFTVTGANPTGGAGVTNASGQAQFCYTGALVGNDTITATAAGLTATARKTWRLPPSTEGCKITYGGRITAANGDKATFGGNAKADGLKGQQEYQDHGPATAMNVHSIDVLSVVCSTDGTQASIFGTATIDGTGTFNYRIDLKDLGEPGTSDTYRIRLSNGYDSGVQTLVGGNVQIH